MSGTRPAIVQYIYPPIDPRVTHAKHECTYICCKWRIITGKWVSPLQSLAGVHQLREDTALCCTSANIDMYPKQALPTPKLTTNIAFYKRQIWAYNLGVHDCSRDDCILWLTGNWLMSLTTLQIWSFTNTKPHCLWWCLWWAEQKYLDVCRWQ